MLRCFIFILKLFNTVLLLIPNTVTPFSYSNIYSVVTTQQCQERNAIIQFSLFDKDILTSDDFGGETYFPLSAVPGSIMTITV